MNKPLDTIYEMLILKHRFSVFPGVLEEGAPGGLKEAFPPILVPISRRGQELWPKTLGGEFVYRLRYPPAVTKAM